MIDAVRGQQPLGQLGQPANAVVLRDIERIDVVGRDPRRVGIDRLIGEDDGIGAQDAAHPGRGDRLLGERSGGLGVRVDATRKTPRAIVHDPHGNADVLGIGGGIQIARREAGACHPDAFEPEISVFGSALPGASERGVGEALRRQVREGRVNLRHSPHTSDRADGSHRGFPDRAREVISRRAGRRSTPG